MGEEEDEEEGRGEKEGKSVPVLFWMLNPIVQMKIFFFNNP